MQSPAEAVEDATPQPEMVLVPLNPTREMIEAAYWDADAEDAAGVWSTMVATWRNKSGTPAVTHEQMVENGVAALLDYDPETGSTYAAVEKFLRHSLGVVRL